MFIKATLTEFRIDAVVFVFINDKNFSLLSGSKLLEVISGLFFMITERSELGVDAGGFVLIMTD